MNLQDIYDQGPCAERWGKLLTALGHGDFSEIKSYYETQGKFPGGQEITLGDVALLNDAADAIWCVRVLDWDDITVRRKFTRKVLLPMCERVAVHTTDISVHFVIDNLRQWCDGNDSVDPLAVARATSAGGAAAGVTQAVVWTAQATARAAAGEAPATREAAAAGVEAARWAAWTAEDVKKWAAAERAQQRRDIIAAYPPLVVKEKTDG